jgi:hypothetical protein
MTRAAIWLDLEAASHSGGYAKPYVRGLDPKGFTLDRLIGLSLVAPLDLEQSFSVTDGTDAAINFVFAEGVLLRLCHPALFLFEA